MDCGANDELMDSSGFGGGVGVDLRGEAVIEDVDGRRSPGFGDTGRTNGSGFDTVAAPAAGVGAGGAGSFIGGGGIMPLLLSIRVTTGREMDISAPSLAAAGALRLTTLGAPAFCLSNEQI